MAALYKIYPGRLHVALTYRSRVKLDFNGQANFSPANPDFAPVLPDQPGTASITLPDIITVGVMGRPRDRSGADLRRQPRPLEHVRPRRHQLPDAPPIARSCRTAATPSRSAAAPTGRSPARWPGLHLRGGLIYDRGAIPSANLGPGLPDADRIDVALGAGYGRGPFRGDLGYLLVSSCPPTPTTGQEGPWARTTRSPTSSA